MDFGTLLINKYVYIKFIVRMSSHTFINNDNVFQEVVKFPLWLFAETYTAYITVIDQRFCITVGQ